MVYNVFMSTNEKNIWFFTILGILILASVTATFYKYYIQHDFQITTEVSCNGSTELCFQVAAVTCTPEDTECTPIEAYDYKIISKNAANILACEKTAEKIDCNEELTCLAREKNCSYKYCTEEALYEGVTCVSQ